ncbi:hypothetical protein R6Q59_023330, partial [Mikania micrantha]
MEPLTKNYMLYFMYRLKLHMKKSAKRIDKWVQIHRWSLLQRIFRMHLNLKWEDFSTLGMLYTIGIQCIYWKLEFHRGAQKLVVP